MKEYMYRALDIATSALHLGELPIASVLVLDGQIIAEGHTAEKSSQQFLLHAELNTLLTADKLRLSFADRKKCELFTTLEPCMMCLGASLSFFLGGITYALESPGDGATQFALESFKKDPGFPGYALPQIKGGLLRQESMNLFKDYLNRHNQGARWEWARSLVLQTGS